MFTDPIPHSKMDDRLLVGFLGVLDEPDVHADVVKIPNEFPSGAFDGNYSCIDVGCDAFGDDDGICLEDVTHLGDSIESALDDAWFCIWHD